MSITGLIISKNIRPAKFYSGYGFFIHSKKKKTAPRKTSNHCDTDGTQCPAEERPVGDVPHPKNSFLEGAARHRVRWDPFVVIALTIL